MQRGEGVTITGGGHKKKFCCWDHAAKWTLAMANQVESRETGVHLRALAELEDAQKAVR